MQIVGSSPATRQLREDVKRLARGRKDVVIIGESGVGKGLTAEAIHNESKDARKPCVRLNIAVIDPSRLRKLVDLAMQSGELYNPIAPDHGNFKLVDGTTLIFEDIDRSGLTAQSSVCDLLAFLRKEKRDLRLIFLLQGPIGAAVKAGTVLPGVTEETKRWEMIMISPLRERRDDIPELVEYFVAQVGKDLGIEGMIIDSNAIGVLVRQEWKENVLELKRMVERSIVLSNDKEVFRLPAGLVNEQAELSRIITRIDEGAEFALDNAMEIIEKGILMRTLEKFEFNQSRAARFLKMTEDTLRYRMKRLGIPTARKQ
ncbi:MAG: sigma 54-interacting transcriptional regulator [Ignavibacteriales bacterium]|nr:sigma 54-interacting transcriptional regulator [Ignavibacteriales bacterium]